MNEAMETPEELATAIVGPLCWVGALMPAAAAKVKAALVAALPEILRIAREDRDTYWKAAIVRAQEAQDRLELQIKGLQDELAKALEPCGLNGCDRPHVMAHRKEGG